MKKIQEQVIIKLAPKESGLFWDVITQAGCEQSGEGIKEYILNYDEREEITEVTLTGRMQEWVEDNPEKVSYMKKNGAVLASALLNNIKRKFTL